MTLLRGRSVLLGVAAGTTLGLLLLAPVWSVVADERAEDLRVATIDQTELVLAALEGRRAGPDGSDAETDARTVRSLRAPGRREVVVVSPTGTVASRPGLQAGDVPTDVVEAVDGATATQGDRPRAVAVGPGEGYVVGGGLVDRDTRVYVLVSSRAVDEANGALLARFGVLVAVAAGLGAVLAWVTAGTRVHRAREETRRERERNADMAHELRTPVGTILAASTLAADAMREQPPEVSRPVQLVADEARRLRLLVDDLLELRRVESAEPAARTETVDLAALLPSVVGARSWPVPVHLDVGAGVHLRGERRDVTRLVINLLDNASRHARSVVRVRCRLDGSTVRLTVADDGPGIPAAESDRVFDRFHRAPGSAAGGTGLGLHIVRAVARRLGGDVHVRPGGHGAELVVELPVASTGRRDRVS